MLEEKLATLLHGIPLAQLRTAYFAMRTGYVRGQPIPLKKIHAIAYAAARLPATYAVLQAVVQQLPYRPASVYDFGAGPATAGLAGCTGTSYTPYEPSPMMRMIGGALHSYTYETVPSDRHFHTVLASYVCNELADPLPTLLKLWHQTTHQLVLVEPGDTRAFQKMLQWRATLLKAGAFLAAPCATAGACPLAATRCCWYVRLARSRIHRAIKGGDRGYEDEAYTYWIFTRQPYQRCTRVLYGKKGQWTLCTAAGLTTVREKKMQPGSVVKDNIG